MKRLEKVERAPEKGAGEEGDGEMVQLENMGITDHAERLWTDEGLGSLALHLSQDTKPIHSVSRVGLHRYALASIGSQSSLT